MFIKIDSSAQPHTYGAVLLGVEDGKLPFKQLPSGFHAHSSLRTTAFRYMPEAVLQCDSLKCGKVFAP